MKGCHRRGIIMFKKWILRLLVVIVFPFAVVFAVFIRVWGEIKSIPFYCWNDVRGEWASLKDQWNMKF